MNFNQVYKIVFVNCEETSVEFFTRMPGFKVYEQIEIQGKSCSVLQLTNGDFMMLVEQDNFEADTIVLKTDDCLRDYCLFSRQQIDSLTRPRYVANGLELSFSDPSGNQFVLIEERDYTEV
uniref:VOC family protein n=1 Tax=Pedobacter schmidteae TaxID=2201271 RepID=UPI000EB443FD|nr:hypothetical protein [Pedobacter schmidteae]